MSTARIGFDRTLAKILDEWRIEWTPTQLALMRTHFEAVLETNVRMNLTRITDPIEAAVKHYADSLALLLWVRSCNIDGKAAFVGVRSVLDVGTGAGFPAVPLAIMRPDWQITALDGTAKKIRFVEQVAKTLRIANLRTVHAHSTHWREACTADVVTVRAVARLGKSLRDTVDLIAPQGWLVAYKTADLKDDELSEARAEYARCRLQMQPPFAYELSSEDEQLQRALYPFHSIV